MQNNRVNRESNNIGFYLGVKIETLSREQSSKDLTSRFEREKTRDRPLKHDYASNGYLKFDQARTQTTKKSQHKRKREDSDGK